MSYALIAQKRTETGRRSKNLEELGFIPAVVYGKGVESQSIKIKRAEFRLVYRQAGMSSLIDLAIEGAGSVKAVVKDVQVHMLSLEPSHVDFHQIRMDEVMTAEVPLNFIGESKAVKEMAGTLVKSMDAVKVSCLPADLPHQIDVDLSVLVGFDNSINVASLKLPKGVTVTDEALATIATVVAPLTEDQLKKMEEEAVGDVSTIKTEAEEKKAADEAKKAEEAAAAEPKK